MVYTGFCDKQNKNYSVEFASINATAKEDLTGKIINGRLNCIYAGLTGCCDHPSQCSIIKNVNK